MTGIKIDTRSHHHSNGGVLKRIASRMRPHSDLTRSNTFDSETLCDTKPRRTPSFKIGVSIHRRTPSESSVGSNSPPNRSAADTALSRALWDEAYDTLRLEPSTSSLIVTYEAIISQELPDDLKMIAHSRVSLPREGELETCDRRRELMFSIMKAGLSKRRGSKASQVEDVSRLILDYIKTKVELAYGEYSSAAIAWSGLCTLTPLLIDPILGHEQFRRGMLHVSGRIAWYMDLIRLLQRPLWSSSDEHAANGYKARDAVLRLYRKVLEFEMNVVCASASAWNAVAKHVVRWNDLDKLIDEIEEAGKAIRVFVDECLVEETKSSLRQLDSDLDITELERLAKEEEEKSKLFDVKEEP